NRAGTLGDDLILQAAGGGLNDFFLFVLREERVALGLIFFAFFLGFFHTLGLHLLLEGHHRLAHFILGHEGFVASQGGFKALGEEVGINLDALALQVLADFHAVAIADLVLFILQR